MSHRRTGRPPPKLLAVSAMAPWPIRNGYSLRVANFLERLVDDWDVTLLSPPSDVGAEDGAPPDARWQTVPGLPATNTLPWLSERKLLTDRVARLLAEGGPWEVALLWNGTEFLDSDLPALPPAVVDRIDCETLQAWRGVAERAPIADRIRRLRKVVDFGLYEATALDGARGIAVTAPDDARWLRRISRRPRIAVIPNGVSLPPLEELPREAPEPRVIFTGVLGYGPNVEAVRFFVERVWPEVRLQVEQARFVAAGRSPSSEVATLLAATPGAELRADVPDMTAEIRRAWVAVAPMRSGSGIKNKVLEAWAASRPVVLSELATNGLSMDTRTRSLSFSDPSRMAAAVVRLLEDEDARRELGEAGRRLAREQHGWDTQAQRLHSLLVETTR